ncbi:MAG TPA: P-loop NTPase, partial [Ktedonobacteraceae bacterium]|nr:P-loop NTPase [Ktedonobacteraceae bacterium]
NFLVVVQSARPALTPAQPNKLVYTVAGVLVGLLLGIALAMLLELLDTRIGTKEALTQLLDWPVLGTIWRAAAEENIVNPIGHNSNVESYSILRANVGLRANIGLTAIDKPLQTLVVTSGNPGEGKSVVAANLAIFMARAGKNTLLIDANLRRPILHEQFGIPAHAMGFSNAVLMFSMQTTTNTLFTSKTDIETSSASVVTNEVSLGSFVRAVDIPNLYVMPSGPLPPNPLELLDSKAIQGLFTALSKCGAEVVIFDAPPLLGLSDASILASKVDGTLVVVDITRASKRNLTQVKAQLEQAKAHVLGYAVNKQRRRRKDTSTSYGYRAEKRSNRDSHSRKITSYSAVSVVTPMVSKQPGIPSQPKRNEPMISMQPGIPSQPKRNEPMISMQPGIPSQPNRNGPTISKQSTTPSQPSRNEPTISKQSPQPSQPKQDEPTIVKQSPQPSQPKQDRQNDGGKHGTNNGDSPANSLGTFDRDQTIIIPLVGATNSRRKTGDLREDG